MSAHRLPSLLLLVLAASLPLPLEVAAQLPATAPTQNAFPGTPAPLAGTASGIERSGSQAPQVTCEGGQLEVRAQNSSLNQILRAVSRCTGMRVNGHVADQRVFGDYGPAAPATVLATLLDGTGTNMLLKESEADQPAELILTARTGGPTPPPASGNDSDNADDDAASANTPQTPYRQAGQRSLAQPGMPPAGMAQGATRTNQTPVPQPYAGSAVTGPTPIPQPTNDVNGSPSNTSPTAASYPTTNSVPLDAINTPSTTPTPNGIVDAPNPPPAGSDTAAALNGAPQGTPGTTNISPTSTTPTSNPGATNTTVPASTTDANSSTQLTPEQIFLQLQERVRMQQQQQQQEENNPQ